MRKTFFLTMLLGWIIAACRESNTPVSTATTVASPTSAPIKTEPILIYETRLETKTGTAYTLDWSHDGETLAAGSGYEITLLNSDLSETIAIVKPESGALGVAWRPDGNQLATIFGYRNQTIRIWNWDSNIKQLNQAQQI